MGIEIKFYDQKLINAAISAPSDSSAGEQDPSATILLNTVVQGDGESNRDGRKITMRSILVEGVVTTAVQNTQSAADTQATIFIALVLDTQTNGATLSSEDVFTNPGANAVTAAGPFRNLQQTKRFKILATRRFTLKMPEMSGDPTSVIIAGLAQRFKIFKTLNKQVNYTGTTETVANIADNSLHIIAYASNTNLSPLISYASRLRFVG